MPFNFISPKAFQSFDSKRTWWRLFQKRVVRIGFDIYVFINAIFTIYTTIVTIWIINIQPFISNILFYTGYINIFQSAISNSLVCKLSRMSTKWGFFSFRIIVKIFHNGKNSDNVVFPILHCFNSVNFFFTLTLSFYRFASYRINSICWIPAGICDEVIGF